MSKKQNPIFEKLDEQIEANKIVLDEAQKAILDADKDLIEELLRIMTEMEGIYTKPKYTKEEMNELKKTELYKLVKEDL